jgi:hypothetical protein
MKMPRGEAYGKLMGDETEDTTGDMKRECPGAWWYALEFMLEIL